MGVRNGEVGVALGQCAGKIGASVEGENVVAVKLLGQGQVGAAADMVRGADDERFMDARS